MKKTGSKKSDDDKLEKSLNIALDLGKQAKINLYENIAKKINAGEKISASELKTFEKLTEELEDGQNEKNNGQNFGNKKKLLDYQDTLRYLNISRRVLSYHISRGNLAQLPSGLFELTELNRWLSTRRNKKKGTTSEKKEKAAARYWDAKSKKEEFAAQAMSGEYVKRDDVRKAAFEAGRLIREHCIAIADRCSPLVAAEMDQYECKQILMSEIKFILEGLADVLSTFE